MVLKGKPITKTRGRLMRKRAAKKVAKKKSYKKRKKVKIT